MFILHAGEDGIVSHRPAVLDAADTPAGGSSLDIQYILLPAVLLAAAWIIYYGATNYSKLEKKLFNLSQSVDDASNCLARFSGPVELTPEFERTDESIAELPLVGPVWREFTRSLVRSNDKMIRSPRPASDSFGTNLLDRSEVDFRRFDAIPNQLIGYGLMFTFIGLLLTLILATPGLRGDVNAVKDALEGLLIAAGSKFITSVVAIFASLQFTVRKNGLLHDLDGRLEALCERIDRLLPPISSEELVTEAHRELERQSSMLADRNTELAQAIAAQLDITLRANLPAAFEPIVVEMKRISTDIHDINEATMKDMIDRFIQELGTSVQAHTRAMTGMLEQVTATIEAMPYQIKAAGDRFEQVFDTVTVRINATLQGAATALDTLLSQAGENVSTSGELLKEISAQLRRMLDEVRAAAQAITDRGKAVDAEATEALADLAVGARRISEATEVFKPLATLGTKLEGLTEQLITVTEGMTAFAQSGRLTITESLQAAETLDNSARGFNESVAGLETSLDGVFRKLAEGIDRHRERVGKAVTDVDYNLGVAVERLSEVVSRFDGRSEQPLRRPSPTQYETEHEVASSSTFRQASRVRPAPPPMSEPETAESGPEATTVETSTNGLDTNVTAGLETGASETDARNPHAPELSVPASNQPQPAGPKRGGRKRPAPEDLQ